MTASIIDLYTGYARNDGADLTDILTAAAQRTDVTPKQFADTYLAYAGQGAGAKDMRELILTDATTCIWIAGKFLKTLGMGKIGVINPSGSFIHETLADAGLQTVRIEEDVMFKNPENLPTNIRALYVTMPNNPTGAFPSEGQFKRLLKVAHERGLGLIVDFCFRLYSPLHQWDQYKMLEATGVPFIGIEDTGKAFALHGRKLGMIVARPQDYARLAAFAKHAPAPERETLAVLTEIISRGGASPIHLPMRKVASRNREVLKNSQLFDIRPGNECAPFAQISFKGGDWPGSWQRAAVEAGGIDMMPLKDFYGQAHPIDGLRAPLNFAPHMFDLFIKRTRELHGEMQKRLSQIQTCFAQRL